ncbi:Bax inhibitor-1 family protein, partial [Staphylococcus aureus]|uniref:Bax inhibitor-1 family protein n=1 Tax=Staphylococcus aureus TaxID=1280 RepID=UPI0038B3FB04
MCFTLCALYSDQYKWIYIGGTLFSGLILTLVLGFISILTGSHMLFQIYTYLGLFIICGFVLYDTQVVVEKFRRG